MFIFPCAPTPHCFEEIGRMAGALLYFLFVIPVIICRLSMAVQHFLDKVTLLQKGYSNKEKFAVHLKKYGGRINTEASVFFQICHLLDLMLKDAN
jgi:hypothetical protein